MNEKKMTKKEIYEELKVFAETGKLSEKLDNETLKAFCDREIAILENKKEKAKALADKKKKEGDKLSEAIFSVLTHDYEPIAAIVEKVDSEEITVSKAVYRLNKLAAAGEVEKADIEVPVGDGKKSRVVKGYRIAETLNKMPADSVEE